MNLALKPLNRTLNIAVFGSGRGSNFQALLTALEGGKIPGTAVRVVISNNSAAGILAIARANNIAAEHISERMCANEDAFVDQVLGTLHTYEINFIVLAGYMKRVPRRIIAEFKNNIINIHPALLPKFGGQGMYGMHVHEAVIAANEEYSGASVHLVDEEYDRGAVVLQKRVGVSPTDTAETLAAKVLKIEHEIIPEAVTMFAEGRIFQPDTVIEN